MWNPWNILCGILFFTHSQYNNRPVWKRKGKQKQEISMKQKLGPDYMEPVYNQHQTTKKMLVSWFVSSVFIVSLKDIHEGSQDMGVTMKPIETLLEMVTRM